MEGGIGWGHGSVGGRGCSTRYLAVTKRLALLRHPKMAAPPCQIRRLEQQVVHLMCSYYVQVGRILCTIFSFMLLALLRQGEPKAASAHPAHPDWRVSRSYARRSVIFPSLRIFCGNRQHHLSLQLRNHSRRREHSVLFLQPIMEALLLGRKWPE
jgi:hypothetical protein